MEKQYKHLTMVERDKITELRYEWKNISEITIPLRYHKQTPNRLELIACLRRAHRKRKQKGISRKERKTKIPNRISIDLRPKSVETRRQFGHWEGDSLVSRKSTAALNSLTERKSRLVLLTKLDRKGAVETKNAIISRLQHLPPNAKRSLTLDNGTENTQHQEITN